MCECWSHLGLDTARGPSPGSLLPRSVLQRVSPVCVKDNNDLVKVSSEIHQSIVEAYTSRSNMTVPLFDLDDPMTHPSGPLFQF